MVLSEDEANASPLNQLKYVNKQLYHETAGLEIKFNRVVLDFYNIESTTNRLLKFVNFCTPNRLSWLSKVVIEQQRTDTEKTVATWLKHQMGTIIKLLHLAAKTPHFTIQLRVPEFSIINYEGNYTPYLFIAYAHLMTWIFRGEDIGDLANEAGTLQAPPHQRTHRYTLGKYRSVVEGFRGRAPNLRFLPYRVEWDEQLFLAQAVEVWSVRAGVIFFEEEK
jgi:hypothetical protein